MAANDHEKRISTSEANIANMSRSLDRMGSYVEKLFELNGQTQTSLALVVESQGRMTKYQGECDTERDDHEKRITAVEGFTGRLVKVACAVTGIGSLASPQLSKLWERIFG